MPNFDDVNKEDKLFSEIALRLVGFGENGILFSFGTAFVLQPFLLVTARHVVEEFISRSKPTRKNNQFELTFWAIQIEWINGEHNYNIWQVVNAYFSPYSDICLLHVGAYNDTAINYQAWKVTPVCLTPPNVGEEVIAFGYHATKFEGSRVSGTGGLEHLALNDTASKSTGVVKQVHMLKRDSVMLPFPCFEVDSQFEPGMSGGLVINPKSELCGIVCSSMPFEGEHYSHVALIWPAIGIEVDFGSTSADIQGIHPLSELIDIGKWMPKGWKNIKVEYIEGQTYPQITYQELVKVEQ